MLTLTPRTRVRVVMADALDLPRCERFRFTFTLDIEPLPTSVEQWIFLPGDSGAVHRLEQLLPAFEARSRRRVGIRYTDAEDSRGARLVWCGPFSLDGRAARSLVATLSLPMLAHGRFVRLPLGPWAARDVAVDSPAATEAA